MNVISVYLLPVLIILLLLFALYKKMNVYAAFSQGAKGAFALISNIFPAILAILIAVTLLQISGVSVFIANLLSPVFNFLGIPPQVCELVLLRPFTGSGSFAVLNNIYLQYGADSYISRAASVIMGSSETVFYVAAIYFSGTKVKKLLYAIPCALAASLFAAILGCLVCRII